jgi:hypothetical protein
VIALSMVFLNSLIMASSALARGMFRRYAVGMAQDAGERRKTSFR